MALAVPVYNDIAMICTLSGSSVSLQDCCDEGYNAACPTWTFNEQTNSCSVMPFNADPS